MKQNQDLFDLIAACPTPYHTAAHIAERLLAAGYTRLNEGEPWSPEPGRGCFVTRGGSSLIAFRVPRTGSFSGFMLAAAHGDSPGWRIRENPEVPGGNAVRLSVEGYGGMICSTWMDRPLSVAGRVMVRSEDGLKARLVDLGEPCAVIPSVAIHMNRKVNEGYAFDPAKDMLPLWRSGEGTFPDAVASAAECGREELLGWDLMVYEPSRGVEWGDYITAPRLDDLQCVFSALTGFLAAEEVAAVPVLCVFDNEEVGSHTKQGAGSTFLYDTLRRLWESLGRGGESEFRQALACSLMLSCDNAHALHPNHPELADRNHAPVMNGGIVLKYNAAQRYTTDAVSAALLRLICEKAGVPVQMFANRADMPGGSTLGNISSSQVSVNAVDIGLAQLAMHSAVETAGAHDTESMVRALAAFFASAVRPDGNGGYRLL